MEKTPLQKLEHAEAQLSILHEYYHTLAMNKDAPDDALAYLEKQIAQKESEIDDLVVTAYRLDV
jgi:hypothetical protein